MAHAVSGRRLTAEARVRSGVSVIFVALRQVFLRIFRLLFVSKSVNSVPTFRGIYRFHLQGSGSPRRNS
jgi:hypothetical protein